MFLGVRLKTLHLWTSLLIVSACVGIITESSSHANDGRRSSCVVITWYVINLILVSVFYWTLLILSFYQVIFILYQRFCTLMKMGKEENPLVYKMLIEWYNFLLKAGYKNIKINRMQRDTKNIEGDKVKSLKSYRAEEKETAVQGMEMGICVFLVCVRFTCVNL